MAQAVRKTNMVDTIKKRILITGATGLIGEELCLALIQKGYELVIFGRSSEIQFRSKFTLPCDYFQWSLPKETVPNLNNINISAVIHLSGESIANSRWTENQKKEIYESRVFSTKNLVTALNTQKNNVRTFISASAIGFYGDRGDESLDESEHSSSDFMGKVCKDWEDEAKKVSFRNVQVRIGLVLSNKGGALAQLEPIFQNGFGGPLGNGNHWMSWIHIKDLVNIFIEALENEKLIGPINGVAPNSVTNNEFTKLFSEVLKVNAFIPTPKIALKLFLGEMSQVVLSSQKIFSKTLKDNNFSFKFENLKEALIDLYGWKQSRYDHLFQSLQWVPQSKDKVFPFFSNEKNLELLTPEFLNFRVLKKSTVEIQEGCEIDYKLKIHGIPAHWRTLITEWNPNNQFNDLQLKGPYKKWDHTHLFEDLAAGTLLIDRIIYQLPMASFGGDLAHAFILKDIKNIFKYRKSKIIQLFNSTFSK